MIMTFVEFINKSRAKGFRGLPAIDGRDPRPSDNKNLVLSWHGTNNDLYLSSEFGFFEVGPVSVKIASSFEANVIGRRYKYLVKDISN